ncbi:transmembrane protease serine 9 [Anopheles gambiae]|uniref:transmembrane protease serine 9 n=1 Tax=Anopheles gambiae TaxID=7165 RepID=UPI002AC93FB3|nr:transmembrane protease serine 9 [Anopheles gambiae]
MYQLLRSVLPVLLIAASVPHTCSGDKMDDSNSGNLIVGGFVVSIDQVPYQAAVLYNGKFSCGGSIIGPRWILTALHCIQTMEPSEYQIVVGTDDPENGTKLQVENMFAPPFLINGSVFDIALVMLRKRLEYNEKVQCLPLLKSIEEIAVGKPVVISGFGSTEEGGYETVLKAANVNILPLEECVKAYGLLIHEHMFCAGYREGQVDTCQGDSGGPLVLDSKLAGVIFYGEGCAREHYPGVYMSVPWFYDWIVNTGDSGGPLVVDGQLAGVVFFGKGCADPNHPGVYISVPWFYDWIVEAARNQSNAENRELCTTYVSVGTQNRSQKTFKCCILSLEYYHSLYSFRLSNMGVLRQADLLVVMLAAVVLPFACAQRLKDKDWSNMIVGGMKVEIEAVPYQAAMLFSESVECGGSIIGPRWIVTSRHCINQHEPVNYAFAVGSTDPYKGKIVKVEKFFVPPESSNDDTYDIALAKLAESLQYSKAVQCIPLLSSKDAIVPGKQAYISGFGVTEENNAEVLKAATIEVLPWQTCQQVYPDVMREFMLCAGILAGGVDSCQGDSGGPLVLDNQLAGVVFYGIGCGEPNHPGAYISVPWFYDWIVGIVSNQLSTEEQELYVTQCISFEHYYSLCFFPFSKMCVLRQVGLLVVVLATISLPISSAQQQKEEQDDSATNMIVGGMKVDIEQVPYQAAILTLGQVHCGGSIIGPRWVLTAYHCVDWLLPNFYEVAVGSTNPYEGQRILVRELFVPPETLSDPNFDIALAKLAHTLQYSSTVQCIPLLTSDSSLIPDTPAYISGFGYTKERASDNILKAAQIKVLPWDYCQQAYPYLMREFMLCAGFKEGKVDSCQGDSGGPLIVNAKLAGVVFYGEGCARPHFPGVYISVPWFSDWIIEVVVQQSTQLEGELCAV